MGNEHEFIDLNKLSQRELLILVATKVEQLGKKNEKVEEAQAEMMLKVNTLENKMEAKSKLWGGVYGFIVSVVTAIISFLLGQR